MENPEPKQEHKWVEKVISEGSIPYLLPNHCPNGWASPPGNVFLVRGPQYLKNRVKIPGGDYLLKPLGFDWIKGPTKISEVLCNPKNRVRIALEEEWSKGHKPFVWAFNLQVPSKDNYSAVAYFVAMDPDTNDNNSLINRFLTGDDLFRKSRLKLIANITKGPWIVRKAVGDQAVVIIGRSLTSAYCMGENFIEVDIDIGSSLVAKAVVHLTFGYLATLTVDLAFVIEGQTESELPERILGAVRFSELDIGLAREIEQLSEKNMKKPPHLSLSNSFLNSTGHGISVLLPGEEKKDSSVSASYVNHDGDEQVGKTGDVDKLESGDRRIITLELSFFGSINSMHKALQGQLIWVVSSGRISLNEQVSPGQLSWTRISFQRENTMMLKHVYFIPPPPQRYMHTSPFYFVKEVDMFL